MRRSGSVLLLLLLLTMAGCGSDGDDDANGGTAPDPAPSSTSAVPTPDGEEDADGSACELLPDARIESLAGEALGEGAETEVAGVLPVCQWGDLTSLGVQAGRVAASEWAKSLPTVVAQLAASGILDGEGVERLERASALVESGSTIPADEACHLFSDLAEIGGNGKDATRALAIVPSRTDPQAISGQSCVDGTYATVLLARPDLTGSGIETLIVERALRVVEKGS